MSHRKPLKLLQNAATLVLLAMSGFVTVILAQNYFEAVLGTQQAQWQFTFMYAPIAIGLAAAAVALSTLWAATTPQLLRTASTVMLAIPLLLSALVISHAY